MKKQTHFLKNKAFTLIELLVVIAIISILTGIILVNLGSSRRMGRDTKRVADINNIALALELYYNKNRSYPDTDDARKPVGLVPEFMPSYPTPPTSDSGDLYGYCKLSNNNYNLGANLENDNSSALKDDADFCVNVETTCIGSTVKVIKCGDYPLGIDSTGIYDLVPAF